MKQYAIDVYLSYGVHHSDMAADKPINFAEHVQLQELGIAAESISFANVTLESEKYVCVRESGESGNSVAIVDLNNIHNMVRRPMSCHLYTSPSPRD